ncbi:MAG: hypothetical protein WBP26_05660 [Candidatus Saccharimonadales bacterium]
MTEQSPRSNPHGPTGQEPFDYAFPKSLQPNPLEGPAPRTDTSAGEHLGLDEVAYWGNDPYYVAAMSPDGKPVFESLTQEQDTARNARLYRKAIDNQALINDARKALDATYDTFEGTPTTTSTNSTNTERARIDAAEQTLKGWERQAADRRAQEQAQLDLQQAQIDAFRRSQDPRTTAATRARQARIESTAARLQEPNSQHRLFGLYQERRMSGDGTELPTNQVERDYILRQVTQHAIELDGIDFATIMRTQKGAENSAWAELHAIRSDRKKIPGETKKQSIARLEGYITYLESIQSFGEQGASQLVQAMLQLGIIEERPGTNGILSRTKMKIKGAVNPAYARSVYVPSKKPEYRLSKEVKKLKADELQAYLNSLSFPSPGPRTP